MEKHNSKKTQTKFDLHDKIRIIMLAVAVIVLFLPYVLTQTICLVDFSNTGPVGDTIGGITAPFIAILVAWITYEAFVVQYKFNKVQRNDTATERFENTFFKLMDIYRDKVNNMSFDNNTHGQSSFRLLFYEFKCVLYYCHKYLPVNEYSNIYLYVGGEIFASGIIENKSHHKLNERIIHNLTHIKSADGYIITEDCFLKNIKALKESDIEGINAELLNVKSDFLKNNSQKIEGLYTDIFPKGSILFFGYLTQLRSYLNHVYFLIKYLRENEEKEEMIEIVNRCRDMFISQLSLHEMAIIKTYSDAESKYIDNDNLSDIGRDDIEFIKLGMHKYEQTFLWTSESFFDMEKD